MNPEGCGEFKRKHRPSGRPTIRWNSESDMKGKNTFLKEALATKPRGVLEMIIELLPGVWRAGEHIR